MIKAAGDRRHWPAGIVRLFGHTLDADRPFLVYEWVDGGDLAGRVTRHRAEQGCGLPPEVVLTILRNIATPLAVMHSWGLVHQDLKPANCLLPETDSWELKLTDFGIGAIVETNNRMTAAQTSRSHQCQMRGSWTPLYMSPEQKRSTRHPSNDIYSLGVMAYQLLLGDISREISLAWRKELKKKLGTPEPLLDLIDACTSLPEDRPKDAGELLKQIDGISSASSPVASLPAHTVQAGNQPASIAQGAALSSASVERRFADFWAAVTEASALGKANPPATEQIYMAGIRQFPRAAPLLGNYANFLLQTPGRRDEAEAFYKRAIEADPFHARSLGNYARIPRTDRRSSGRD